MHGRAAVLALSTILPIACSSGSTIRREPADLSGAAAESAERPTASATEAAPVVDWSGIPPEQRSAVLEVLDQTFCPACLCAESVAQCLTPRQPCGCPDCAAIMSRFVLNGFREGRGADEILDLTADAWIEAFEAAPVAFPLDGQPTKGAPGGTSVVEFADFTCAHCKSVAPILDRLVENDPNVRLTFFFYPLRAGGPPILTAEAAAEAHAQGRFWPFARALYGESRPPDGAALVALAERVGLDAAAVGSALQDERHQATVMADKTIGQQAGVLGTPEIFIGGRRFALPRTLENLEIWVDMERTRGQCAGEEP